LLSSKKFDLRHQRIVDDRLIRRNDKIEIMLREQIGAVGIGLGKFGVAKHAKGARERFRVAWHALEYGMDDFIEIIIIHSVTRFSAPNDSDRPLDHAVFFPDGIFPHRINVFLRQDKLKTQIFIMFGDHAVFGCFQIIADNFLNIPFFARHHDLIEHDLLHIPLQNTAAHKPQIEMESLSLDAPNDAGDKAVIAESIRQSSIKSDVIFAAGHRFDIGESVAPGRQIKLIGFVDKLRDALKIIRGERTDFRYHI
jgi:hypothetical protein